MKQRGRPRKIREESLEALAPKLLHQEKESPENPTQELLREFVMRIEVVEDEKIIAQRTILDIYAEAKEQGISTILLRELIRLRKLSQNDRDAYEATRTMYMQTLGAKP